MLEPPEVIIFGQLVEASEGGCLGPGEPLQSLPCCPVGWGTDTFRMCSHPGQEALGQVKDHDGLKREAWGAWVA